jgi:hypothetical protein
MRTSRARAALLLALLLAATAMAPAADAIPPGGRIIGPEPEYFGDPDTPPNSPVSIKEQEDWLSVVSRMRLVVVGRLLVVASSLNPAATPVRHDRARPSRER